MPERRFALGVSDMINDPWGGGDQLNDSRDEAMHLLGIHKRTVVGKHLQSLIPVSEAVSEIEDLVRRDLTQYTAFKLDDRLITSHETYYTRQVLGDNGRAVDRMYKLPRRWRLEAKLSEIALLRIPFYDELPRLRQGQDITDVVTDPYGLCLWLNQARAIDANNQALDLPAGEAYFVPLNYPELLLNKAVPGDVVGPYGGASLQSVNE